MTLTEAYPVENGVFGGLVSNFMHRDYSVYFQYFCRHVLGSLREATP